MDLTMGFVGTTWNEAYYQTWHQVVDGRYTAESYDFQFDHHGAVGNDQLDSIKSPLLCGIDPAAVAVLKSADYASTFIATPAFASRLQTLLQIGDESLLRFYSDNLDRELSEVDHLVFQQLDLRGDSRAASFARFAAQGLTNTRNGARYAESLRAAFDQRKSELAAIIEEQRAMVRQALEEQNEQAEQLVFDYQGLLWQRERHRMETYTFEWTDLGWMWLHRDPPPHAVDVDTISWRKLTVDVENTGKMDEVYAYTIFPAVGRLYRLNASGKSRFYVGTRAEQRMLMLEDRRAVVYVLGIKGDRYFLDSMSYDTDVDNELRLQLRRVNRKAFVQAIGRYDRFGVENQIRRDLEFQRSLEQERQRREELRRHQIVLERLYARAFPGCYPLDFEQAERLFREKCAACHDPDMVHAQTGPALAGVPGRRTIRWFSMFTRDSQALIDVGEPQALEQWQLWRPTIMTSFEELTDQELVSLYFYIDQFDSEGL